MARGHKCPQCGYYMYAKKEQHQPRGSWVTYQCRNNNCRYELRTFEGK